MKRVSKGSFGYIKASRQFTILRTIIIFAICIGIFVLGLVLYHTNKNVFSIIAALGCLPTGWSAVNMIMFLRAKTCSEETYKKVEEHKGNLLIQYELEMTSYDTNYPIAAATVLDKNVCCYTEQKDMDINDCEKHIHTQIMQSGYSSYTIKVFTDLDKFVNRLDQLEELRREKNIDPQAIEDAWQPGTVQTCASVLRSISL